MTGLPEFGQKVKIWPFPGRKVQDGPRPVDQAGGGRFLAEGREVVWSPFYHEQLRSGDILLHAPPEDKPEEKADAKADAKKVKV